MYVKREIPRWVKVILIIILMILGLAAAAVLRLQDRMIFHPNQYEEGYQLLAGDERFQEIAVEKPDGTFYRGWYRPSSQALSGRKAPLLIYFGGNMQSSASAFCTWERNESWPYFGTCSVLMLDYPGYGLSDGRPAEKTILPMAEAAYEYGLTLAETDPENIVVMGYSIGTGPASYLASVRQVSGLILLAPYDRLTNMYNRYVNIFHGPMELLAKHKFDSVKRAADVTVLPLIMASKGDEIIPYTLSENLASAFPAGARFILTDGTAEGPDGLVSHTDVPVRQQNFEAIQAYLKEVAAARQQGI